MSFRLCSTLLKFPYLRRSLRSLNISLNIFLTIFALILLVYIVKIQPDRVMQLGYNISLMFFKLNYLNLQHNIKISIFLSLLRKQRKHLTYTGPVYLLCLKTS